MPPDHPLPRWLVYTIFLGLYLTFRGYHSFDGDQAYRLPLLLHQQDPQLYVADPFVKAFDDFNPHRGSLVVLDLATRPLGLPAGLFLLFVLTFVATCSAIDLLARGVWPAMGPGAGLAAIALLLAAKAGNIGTNHIFEAMVLDRQMAFALGWLAIAQQISLPGRRRTLVIAAIASATLIHPSAGLQLALVLIASSTAWWMLGRWTNVELRAAAQVYLGMALAVVPGIIFNLASGPGLMGNMPERDFWLLSVELQSPQHMLPHLWRMPQWLAFASYFALAALTFCNLKAGLQFEPEANRQATSSPLNWPPARLRLIISLAVIAAGLAVSWFAIERLHAVRVTVFQAFRMATIARGIALIIVSGRIVALWRTGEWLSRMRAILIPVAVIGDWLMVVVTVTELAVSAASAACRCTSLRLARAVEAAVFFGFLGLGVNFLGHHDTEYGHVPLLAATATGVVFAALRFPPLLRGGSGGCIPTAEQTPPLSLPRLVSGGSGVCIPTAEVTPPNTVPPLRRPALTGEASAGLLKRWFGGRCIEVLPENGFVAPGRKAGTLSPRERSGVRVASQASGRAFRWTPRRKHAILLASWTVPLAALLACAVPLESSIARSPIVRGLLARCRFLPVPTDDVERLAIWCREHTPPTARFIGPPGPKTFRLWSQRSLAFNRSASPYHASGLSDWFSRFQDHVAFHGPAADFVRRYVSDRHGFEARYDRLSDSDRAALALRQGAEYVITQAPRTSTDTRAASAADSPLELLHVEGRYAVSRLRSAQLAQRQR
jgi:hypothetical protein